MQIALSLISEPFGNHEQLFLWTTGSEIIPGGNQHARANICLLTDTRCFVLNFQLAFLYFNYFNRNGNWRKRQRQRIGPTRGQPRRRVGSRGRFEQKEQGNEGLWSKVFGLFSLLLWVYPISICLSSDIYSLSCVAYTASRYFKMNLSFGIVLISILLCF